MHFIDCIDKIESCTLFSLVFFVKNILVNKKRNCYTESVDAMFHFSSHGYNRTINAHNHICHLNLFSDKANDLSKKYFERFHQETRMMKMKI